MYYTSLGYLVTPTVPLTRDRTEFPFWFAICTAVSPFGFSTFTIAEKWDSEFLQAPFTVALESTLSVNVIHQISNRHKSIFNFDKVIYVF